jgi:hypothetical protein
MPLADYAHHNEEAERIWWEEEGKHHDSDMEAHQFDDLPGVGAYGPADAYAEELGEIDDDVELIEMLNDDRLTSIQHSLIKYEIKRRGITLAKPTLIIGVGGYDLPQVSWENFDPPKDLRIIVRDYEKGNVPDENGDLYEDTEL